MTHDDIRSTRYARRNGYRRSAEYAEYAEPIGADVPQGDLPSLLGDRWETDEGIYDHFLEILPPLGWRGDAFCMSESSFDGATSKSSREGDRHWCEFARYPGRRAA